MTATDLLAQARGLLLDFDGPITGLMPPPANAEAAAAAREALGDHPLPLDVAATTDHLAVLRYADAQTPDRLAKVEAACVSAEVKAARNSKPSPEIGGWWALAERRRIPVGIVSNNSEAAVRVFLDRYGWTERVTTYACREPGEVGLMKPNPHLLLTAVERLSLEANDCVFIGDSVSDVVAGHLAGVPVIGLAKNATRARALQDAGADALLPRA